MSNAQTILVGTVVVPAFPSEYGAALTVQNSGAVTVFLGDATGMNVATGFPLSPGSTIVWDKGRPLYAVVASGTGQVTVLANSGSLNDVSAIATAIIDAGLANDIADRIALVGVPTNQGTTAGQTFTPTAYVTNSTNTSTPTRTLIAAPGAGKCIILDTVILGVSAGGALNTTLVLKDSSGATIFYLDAGDRYGDGAATFQAHSLPLPVNSAAILTLSWSATPSSQTEGIATILYAIGDAA